MSPEKAFLCLSLYNVVQLSMTLFFQSAISMVGEAFVSINRIQDFISLAERDSQQNRRTFLPPNPKVLL